MGTKLEFAAKNTLDNQLKLLNELDDYLIQLDSGDFKVLNKTRFKYILNFFIKYSYEEDLRETCQFLNQF